MAKQSYKASRAWYKRQISNAKAAQKPKIISRKLMRK